jgi:hypothetical protein
VRYDGDKTAIKWRYLRAPKVFDNWPHSLAKNPSYALTGVASSWRRRFQ